MHWPYTLDLLDSLMAAQVGSALMMTAVLLGWPFGRSARVLLLAGIWLSALAPVLVPWVASHVAASGGAVLRVVLFASATLGTLGAGVSRRRRVVVAALVGQVALWLLTGFVQQSDGELAALHMAWLGLLAGVLARPLPLTPAGDCPADAERSHALHDAGAFALGTALATVVCLQVLQRRDGSADEWGYTFQAAVFAKGHVVAQQPRCWHYLEAFYVFHSGGRLFSQYTPGWPMFLVPFVWMRAIWLGAPVSMGLMAWGMARLGRSAMRGAHGAGDPAPSARVVGMAGTWAALLSVLGTSVLVNAASRYSHVYVLALYAWSLEALIQVTTPGLPRRRQILWALVLGTAAVQNVAVRPADGAFAGIGLAALFAVALARRRVGRHALGWAAATAVFWGLVTLVILRVQVGRWFATGYAFNTTLRPWNGVKFSLPAPSEWKYGVPLATGAFCWWPTSIPLGLAGLARMRGRAGELALAMGLSCIPYVVFCMFLDLDQRGYDWGYGPRYLMVLVVPAALGCAVVLAPLTASALQRATVGRAALARAAPLALAVGALVAAWLRIVPLEWATVAAQTEQHSALQRAIDDAHLDHAIVLCGPRTTGFADMDMTTNLPLDLYPDQPVIVATDSDAPEAAAQCLRSEFPGRRLYHASGYSDVVITPMPEP